MKLPTIADQDPWLEPYRDTLEYQQAYLRQAERRLLDGSPLESFALGHLYFGLHRNKQSWLFREWAPNAAAIYLLCEHNDWQDDLAPPRRPGNPFHLRYIPQKARHHHLLI